MNKERHVCARRRVGEAAGSDGLVGDRTRLLSAFLDTPPNQYYGAPGMETLDVQDDPYLRALRPLVESSLACWRESSRHLRSMRLTRCQFDVIATLGDTEGRTCAELSAATLVTKGTLTGVLDRLAAKGLIQRSTVRGDRRCITVRLTDKGNAL